MYQHQQLIEQAKALGIKVTDVSEIMQFPFAILEYNGFSELVRDGVPTSFINVRSQFYCDNKQLTKLVYEKLEIPYPKSITFSSADALELKDFFKQGRNYVCKPLDATNGIGVVTGIKEWGDVQKYFSQHQDLASLFMLEEQVKGEDLRIHVLGGKIVAACIREPAFVIGNGKDTLHTLIEERRAVMRNQNPNNFLEIDAAARLLLEQQHIQLMDIPEPNRKIHLKFISNMAQGGIATDVTDEIHPFYQEWVKKLVDYLKTGYFGLDLMTTNHQENPMKHTKTLEINARADWLHHTFSEGRTHDMAMMILREVFGN